ncbi:unnamed protein product [Vicia faba]|uniref:Uncharacterized protein n=1 Tax=Vicia faba TaxID=3906 RepID=A0AAV0ZBX6_VICFA|nr:unnamed protein product [Vicia faba]
MFTFPFIWDKRRSMAISLFDDFQPVVSPDIQYKYDKFGLGFTSSAQKAIRRTRVGGPPLKISNREVNAVEDDENGCNLEDWIFQLSVEGSIIGRIEILSRSLLSHNNLSLHFVGSVILKQFKLLKPCVLPEAQLVHL